MSVFWYYAQNEKAVGPLTLAELGAILSRVPSAKHALVWRNGFPSWVYAGDVKELATFLISPPPLPTRLPKAKPPRAGSVLNSWLLVCICAGVLWGVAGYALYPYSSVLIVLLPILSAAAIATSLWRRKYNISVGLLVGSALGALAAAGAVNYRLESDKAVALGFSSVPDMNAAKRLNLTPQQFAERRAQEAERVATAEKQRKEREAAENACRKDWAKCADNGEIVNKYSGWTMVQVRCQMAATEQAKYGDPEWPWLAFGSYLRGTDYVKTGLAVAIEKDAKFQNGFGAKVHSQVMCKYDLRSQNVISVSIVPR
jgi:hypothetical protein